MEKIDFTSGIKEYYGRLINTIESLDIEELNDSMNLIYETYKKGGNIYICGNGGSASTASHFANDFNKGISEYVEQKFNFVCLNDNMATIMAIANDCGYEKVFSMQLENRITPKDILIGISGSGNSKNVINAVEYAKEKGAKIIGISGYKGGKLKELSDYHMHVAIEDMQIDEDVHMTFDHMMMKVFYNYLVKGVISGDQI